MLRFGAVVPMLATASAPFHDPDFAYEAKLDGVRALAFVDGDGTVRLQNRRLRDVSETYSDVREALSQRASTPGVLDGEVVVLLDGMPDFPSILARENAGPRRRAAALREHPATYYVFDVLATREEILDAPLEERRERIADFADGECVRANPPLRGDGYEVFRRLAEAGFEGLVAKRRGSPYRPGVRSPDWRKVKARREVDAVVGGWTEGQGGRAGAVGALAVGLYGDRGLVYVGRVGSGLTGDAARTLRRDLPRKDQSPFANDAGPDVRFVAPRLVARVAFHEWTRDGRLRAPSLVGFRTDKAPEDCTFAAEVPPG